MYFEKKTFKVLYCIIAQNRKKQKQLYLYSKCFHLICLAFSKREWLVFTFSDRVEVCLLAHGGQQRQSTDVHPHFSIAAVLPGVVLNHVEQPTHQIQHTMLRVVLYTKITHFKTSSPTNKSQTDNDKRPVLPGQPAKWPGSCWWNPAGSSRRSVVSPRRWWCGGPLGVYWLLPWRKHQLKEKNMAGGHEKMKKMQR